MFEIPVDCLKHLSRPVIPQPIMCRPVSIAVQNRPELSGAVRKCPLVSGLLRKGRGLGTMGGRGGTGGTGCECWPERRRGGGMLASQPITGQ